MLANWWLEHAPPPPPPRFMSNMATPCTVLPALLHSHDVSKNGKRKPYTPSDHLLSRFREEFKLQAGTREEELHAWRCKRERERENAMNAIHCILPWR